MKEAGMQLVCPPKSFSPGDFEISDARLGCRNWLANGVCLFFGESLPQQ